MKFRWLVTLLGISCILLLPLSAMAQDPDLNADTDRMRHPVPKYNLQFWRPAPNPGDYLTTYGSMIDRDHWRLTGGFYIDYAHVPMDIAYSDQKSDLAVIKNQTFMDLYLSLSLFSWVEVALSMPFVLYENTDFWNEQIGFPLRKAHETSGVGDLRIVVKGKILELGKYPVGLALIGDLSTQTGTKGILVSDEYPTFTINAALEFNPWDKARMAVNVGFRARKQRDVYGYTLGNAFIIAGAASIPFFHQDLDFIADFRGEIATEPDDRNLTVNERPCEADFAFRYRILNGKTEWWRGLALTAGVGFGLNAVGSPDVRAILGLNFHWVNGGLLGLEYEYGGYMTAVDPCPDPELTPPSQIPERCRNVVVDSDGDTIPDKDDKCPFAGRAGYIDEFGCSPDRDGDTVPDYMDLCPDEGGRVDKNGCPITLDTDGDTIPDIKDSCPTEPETFNGYEDEDGCPDADPDALVELSAGKINIKEQVFFETSKAVIKSESFELLDQVAKLLVDNPHVGNVTVEGHTDSRGKYKYNVKLSQDRAESVMNYLIKRGVEASRLNAIGYGPDRPIDTNDTSEGRARNRRVEFVVLGLPDDQKK